ncbi:Mbov_0121 family peptidase domain-containing ABC transporter [Mycoplasmopsis columboralis]|nr:cysteine peptidase family C39 domain-containing protein [Mycoplasmopsis columboralis]
MKYQYDSKDCSLVVAEFFINKLTDHKVSINDLKMQVSYQNEGISLGTLKNLLAKYNVKMDVFNCEPETFKKLEKSEFPLAAVIAKDNNQHMIVITKFDKNHIFCIDPFQGQIKYTWEQFFELFLKILVSFSLSNEKPDTQNHAQFGELKIKHNKIQIIMYLNKLIESILILLIPIVNRFILSELIPFNLGKHLIFITGTLCWLIVVQHIFKYIGEKILFEHLLKKANEKKLEILTTLRERNFFQINQINSTELINRINSVDTILLFKSNFGPLLMQNLLFLTIGILILFKTNIFLLLAIVFYCAILLIINFFILDKYDYFYKTQIQNNIQINALIEDFFNYVKGYTHVDFEMKLKNKIIQKTANNATINVQTHSFFTFVENLSNVIEILGPIIIISLGAFQIWSNKLNLVDLIFVLTASSILIRATKSFWPMLNLYNQFKIAKQLLGFFSFNLSSSNYMCTHNTIEIKEIQLSYLDFSYIQNSNNKNLNIQNLIIDQNTHLTGENGSGKTTLCGILTGNLKHQNGLFKVNDETIQPTECIAYKRASLYLSGELNLRNIKVSEYLQDLNTTHLFEISEKLNLQKLPQKIKSIYSKNVSDLSNGEKQIVNFLKSFEKRYSLVVFDEAFDNLSPDLFKEVKQLSQNILLNSLIIEVSHNQNYLFDHSKEVHLEGSFYQH